MMRNAPWVSTANLYDADPRDWRLTDGGAVGPHENLCHDSLLCRAGLLRT